MSLEQSVTALEQRNAELVSEVVRARDAVMGLSNMYTTITLGLAGTEDGQYFTVPGNGAYQKLYQHDGAQAPLIATYPNKSDLTDALTTLNTAMSDHIALPDPHDQYAEIAGQVFTGDIEAPALDVLDDNGLAKIIVGSGSNIANSIHGIEFRDRYGASGFTDGQVGSYIRTLRNGSLGSYNLTFGTTASTGSDAVERMRIDKSGNITPGSDNTQTLGSASFRWSEVFAGTGTINTSDAREKTSVRGMTKSEVSAAKDLSKEIGIYQFLAAVEKKGDEARRHVGLTVQRAIEIMAAHGLEPFNYGFICFDAWDDIFVEHAEVLAVKAVEESEESEAVEAVEAREAWTEKTREAGDRYAFRYDQLNLFIARGIEARLSDLEDNA